MKGVGHISGYISFSFRVGKHSVFTIREKRTAVNSYDLLNTLSTELGIFASHPLIRISVWYITVVNTILQRAELYNEKEKTEPKLEVL